MKRKAWIIDKKWPLAPKCVRDKTSQPKGCCLWTLELICGQGEWGGVWVRGQERLPCIMSHSELLAVSAGVGRVNSSRHSASMYGVHCLVLVVELLLSRTPGFGGFMWYQMLFTAKSGVILRMCVVCVCTVGLFHGGREL